MGNILEPKLRAKLLVLLWSVACGDDVMVSTTSAPAVADGGGPGEAVVNERARTTTRKIDAGAARAVDAGSASARASGSKPRDAGTAPANAASGAGTGADKPVLDAGAVSAAQDDAGEMEDDDAGTELTPQLIEFTPMYSAYDGVHPYQLTPNVPRAADDAVDPLDPTTVRFEIDSEYFIRDPFPELPGALKLTTKRAGLTRIAVTATTRAGAAVRGEASVYITAVSPDEWAAGESRYNTGSMIAWTSGPCNVPDPSTSCKLPCSTLAAFPQTTACAGCHGQDSTWEHAIQYTPTQTAGYSNEQLVSLFTEAARPAGMPYNSKLLQDAELPECVFALMHTWELSDDEKRGVIAQLRAIAPQVIE